MDFETGRNVEIVFVEVDNFEKLLDVSSEEISTHSVESDSEFVRGKYKYESTPLQGTPTVCEGYLLNAGNPNLFAITKQYDRPFWSQLFNKLSEASRTEIMAPKYPQSAISDFYETFVRGPYSVSFISELREYSVISSSESSIDPEQEMKEASMGSREPSDDWIAEIASELAQEKYISIADVQLSMESLPIIRFSNPLEFGRIQPEEVDDELIALLFKRAMNLFNDTVPSVEEVKSGA